MLSENTGGEGKSFEKAQEVTGYGHGNGEGIENPDEATKRLAEEFSFFGNTKNPLKMMDGSNGSSSRMNPGNIAEGGT